MIGTPALNLDYQRRPLDRLGIGLLLAGIVLLATAAWAYWNAQQTWSQVQSSLTREAGARAGKQKAAGKPAVAVDAAAVRRAMQQLDIPWSALFTALEQSKPENVVLLAIEPDAKTRMARTTAEAPNLEAMLDYARRLKEKGFVNDAFIADHEMDADGNGEVRFSIVFSWKTLQ